MTELSPIIDLVECPLTNLATILRPLFRSGTLPDDAEMQVIDRVVALRVLRALQQTHGGSRLALSLHDLADFLRRLVPHRKRSELDNRRLPWSTRITTWADLVDLDAGIIVERNSVRLDASAKRAVERRRRQAQSGLLKSR